jgi:ribosomal protein L37AE/L43A
MVPEYGKRVGRQWKTLDARPVLQDCCSRVGRFAPKRSACECGRCGSAVGSVALLVSIRLQTASALDGQHQLR